MTNNNFKNQAKAYALSVISLCLLVLNFGFAYKSLAQTQKTTVAFEPPPRRDAPRGGTGSGGSRPANRVCLSKTSPQSDSLVALSPGRNLGLTSMERPTIMVYLPETKAKVGEFSLFDAKMKGVYQVNVPISNRAGFVSVSLPQNAPALVKGQAYYWSFALACNPRDRTDDWVVGGWIEYARFDSKLKLQLARTKGVERVSLLARNGFWYDALTSLLREIQIEPNNRVLIRNWVELLTSGGLRNIASKPIIVLIGKL